MKNLEKKNLQQFVDCQITSRQMHCLKGGDGDTNDGGGGTGNGDDDVDDGIIIDIVSL